MEPIVTLTCVEANAPHDVSVTWTQEQTHLQSGYGKPSATGPQEVISKLNISTQDWTGGKVYFCIVSHDDIPTPIRKKIFKDPVSYTKQPSVYLLLPSAEELSAQQSLTLSCLVKNFAPKEIFVEWTVNDQLIDANKYKNTELMADSADYSTYSMLSISAGDWDRGYSYSCVVGHETFPLKTLTRAVNKSGVFGFQVSFPFLDCDSPEPVKISFLPPSPKQVLMEPIATLTCVVANAPHDVNVTWTQEQTHLQSGYGKPSATGPQEVISKLNISTQDWTSGKVYFCIVSHDDMPTPIRKKIFKEPVSYTKQPSVYLLLPSAEELSAQQSLTLSCLVKNFAPKEIFVEWTVNDQLIDANKYKNTELMADSADYSTYSMLSISAGDWDRGYSYSCVVGHETFPLKTLTRAVNKSSDCDPPEPVKISFLPPSPKQVLMEPIVTLTCVVANAPHDVNVTWTQEQTHLQSGYGKPSATGPQEVISKLNISTQDWTSGKVYFCIVSHDDMPTPIRKKIFKEPVSYTKQPSVYLLLPSAEELSAQQSLTLSCLVKNFAPKEIFVEWTVNDQLIDANKYKNTELMADSADYSTYSMLSISAGDWDRGYSYSCVVGHETFPLKTLTRAVNKSSDCDPPEPVKISFLPPSPKQVLMEPIVTLTCVVANAPHDVNVTWTQEQTHLQSGYGKPSATGPQEVISKLNISTQDWTSGKVYFCIVSHDDMPTPIRKKIFKEPVSYTKQPSVYLLLPSAEELSAQQSLTLSCLVKNFAPKEIFVEWTVNDQLIDANKYKNTELMADSADYSTYSMLSISAGDWDRGYSYSCVVGHETFPLKTLTRAVNKSSDCDPPEPVKISFLPPSPKQVLMEPIVTLTCVVANAPHDVNVTWTQEQTHLQSGYGKPSATGPQEVISKLNISTQDWTSGKVYFCIVSHDDMPTPIRKKIFKEPVSYTKQPSVYLLLPSAEELSAQQSLTLSCLVKNFAPKEIFVEWTVNDQLIDANKYKNTELMADSADYSTYSMLSISAGDWDRGYSYSCVVGHETFPLKTLTRAVNKSSDCDPPEPVKISFLPPSPKQVLMEPIVTLTCVVANAPHDVNVTWTQEQTHLQSGYGKPSATGPQEVISKLNISTQDWTSGKVYFCIVSHDDMPTPIRKKIFKEPVSYTKQPSVYLLLPSAEELSAQQSLTLSCLVKNFAPKEIFVEWTVNDQLIDANKYKNTELMADSADYSTYSMLSISAGDWDRGYSYSCVVGHETFPLKTLTRAVNKSSDCDPPEPVKISFLPPSPKQVLMEPIVTLTCVVANAPHDVNVTWTQEQTHLQSGYGKPSATGPQEVISKLNISTQDWTGGKVYFCIVSHDDMPTPIRKKIFKEPVSYTKQPSVYLLLPSAEELSAQQSLTLSCLVKNFAPKEIFVEWTVNDQLIDANKYKNTELMADSADYSTYSMLSISAGDWDRGYSYSCVVGHETFPLKTLTRAVNKSSDCDPPEPVKISFLPPSPKQVLMEPIVTLTCVVANAPHDVNVTWTQEQTHLQSGYGKPSATGPQEVISKLNISTQDWTSGKVYFCIVSHDDMPTPIRKKIFKEPVEYTKQPSVYLLLPSAEELSAQQSLTLSCLVKNFAPKEIFVEWTVNDQLIDANKYKNTELMADSADYSTYSMLSISAGDWDRGYSYSCVVGHETFPLKTLTRAVNKSSDCDPPEPVKISFLPPSPKQVLMEPIVTLTCVVANAPHDVNVTWTQEQTHLQSGYGKPSATGPQEVISKLNISTQDWTGGKVYFCIVSHDDIPTPIRKKIFKEPVEYTKQPSVYLLLPSAEELSAQQSLTLSCLVKNFAPKEIFVEWTVNDQLIDANKYKNTELMADSADYSTYSMLSISAGDWDRGSSYSCVVGHETFPLKTLTRAVNKSSGKPNFVNISLVLMDTANACQ
ncbi:uncharacterized protein LOC103173400 [Callorhinchus milii]|uniref:uncharacterized protein LOC103173400 n=1 Tax=Callorhinchus milii TaxID=7868 RepID=UPI001C3F9925|nr:uncharacterized protein LOC103173400 [Callorhinchus milii]